MNSIIKDWKFRLIQFIRLKYDTILLFVGIAIVFYLCMSLIRADYLYRNVCTEKYAYHKEYWLNGMWTEEMMDELSVIFNDSDDDCVIAMGLPVGNILYLRMVNLFLSTGAICEEENIDLQKWSDISNSVIIEGRLKNAIYTRDNTDYVLVDGLEYVVLGIVNEDEILGINVYVNWCNLDDKHRKKFLERFESAYEDNNAGDSEYLELQVGSRTNMEKELASLEGLFSENIKKSWDYTDEIKELRGALIKKMKFLYLLMGLFGIYSLFCVTGLWIARRKRELLIRRMLGFSYFRLCIVAIKEMMFANAFAFALVFMIEMIQLIYHIGGKLLTTQVFLMVILSFLVTIGIQGVLIAAQVEKIIKIQPTQNNIDSL